jgi:tight adherence protein C
VAAQSELSAALAAAFAFLGLLLLFLGLYQVGTFAAYRRRLFQAFQFLRKPRALEFQLQRTHYIPQRSKKILQRLSNLSIPQDGWQGDNLRLKFIRSGVDFDRFALIYFAARTVLTFFVPILVYGIYVSFNEEASLQVGVTTSVVLAAAGYYGPEQLMQYLANARRTEMQAALPDVLDLLVICTESGLSLDQAIGRVAGEVARNNPLAAREFQLASLEIRAGISRSTAFRNLALRTELDDLSAFATMVIQAERFGSGIAGSLRSLSDLMRVRRMQRAEEAAAKLPTKMLLPLVICVFPSLFIVILGPAVMSIKTMLAG